MGKSLEQPWIMVNLGLRNKMFKNCYSGFLTYPLMLLESNNDKKCLVIIVVEWDVNFYNDFIKEPSLVNTRMYSNYTNIPSKDTPILTTTQ